MHNKYIYYACGAFKAIRPEFAGRVRYLGGRTDHHRRGIQDVSEPAGDEPRAAEAAMDV